MGVVEASESDRPTHMSIIEDRVQLTARFAGICGLQPTCEAGHYPVRRSMR